jgi:prefoldin subunit 5
VKKLSSVPTKIEELENTLKQLKQEKATITQQWNATEKRLNEIKSLIDGQTSYWNLTAPSKDDQITLFSPLDVNSLEEHLKTIVVLKETILNDYESVKETSNANYAEHLYQKNTCAMKSWSESYNSRKKIIEERTATLQKSIESWQLDISMINIALSQLDKAKEELETKLKERKSLTEVPKSGYLLNFKFWGHHSN